MGLFGKVKDRFKKVQADHKAKEEERNFQRHIEEETYKENYVKRGRQEARRRGVKRAINDARRDLDRHTPGFGAVGGYLWGGDSQSRREAAANEILGGIGGESTDFIYGSKRKKGDEIF